MPHIKNQNSKLKIATTLGVIILGAGASSRMGRPKLLLPWGKTSVVGHLVGQWQALGAGQIAVVHRPNDAPLDAELNRLNFPAHDRIENPQPERDMLSSIICAANWNGWKKEISSWAVVLGDQPQLKLETLRTVVEFSAQRPDAICQPEFCGHARHPVILPRKAFDDLKNSGAATLKDFLNLVRLPRVQCVVTDAGLSLDMDTPDDYKRLNIFHRTA
jgi:molybdenum cofactor cytidylyltransferase